LNLFSEENILFQDADVVWRALADYQKLSIENGVKLDFPDALICQTGKDVAMYYEESFNGFYTFDRAAQSLPGAIAP